MNTDELVNNLLPLLQAKLNAATTNTLEGLSHPQREKSQAERFTPANERSTAGGFATPETVQEVVSFPRLDTRLSTYSIKGILQNNPEPNDGILRPQEIDIELLALFPTEARGRDKQLQKIQKEIYTSMRPLIFTLQFLETTDISSEASPEFRDEIVNKLQEVLALNFHAAEGVRIERRIALAKSIKWNNSLIEACEKVDSSAEGDTELFGPEFRERFHAEAKNWKHHRYLNAIQQSHQPRGGYVRGRGRGRGRGGFTELGKSDGRTSYGGAKNWGKGYGGGTSGNATSDN